MWRVRHQRIGLYPISHCAIGIANGWLNGLLASSHGHVPLTAIDHPPNMLPTCIVFMAKPGKRAVRIYGTPCDLDAVVASGMLGVR